MLINVIYSGAWISQYISDMLDSRLQVQPAGVDITVAQVHRFKGTGHLDFDNSQRELPLMEELTSDEKGWFNLQPGSYLVTYGEIIEVPPQAAGILLPRSSLMRMGATIVSALWDPGYKGRGKGLLIVTHPVRLKQRARIAQIIFLKLDQTPARLYKGQYQHESLDPPK